MLRRFLQITTLGLILQAPAALFADTTFTWSGTDPANGYLLSGTATFKTPTADILNGGFDLMITVTNTATTLISASQDLLAALFFDINGGGGLGPLGMLSATTSSAGLFNAAGTTGSGAVTNICSTGQVGTALTNKCPTQIAGGWQAGYWSTGVANQPLRTAPLAGVTSHYGIGTAGYGVFSGSDVGSSNYSIAPSVGTTSNPNGSVNFPLVDGTATFTLYGLSTSTITISNVFAAYGTGPEVVDAATNITAVPEPGTLTQVAGGGLLILIGGLFRKRRA
jgi:hypothetical protein